MPRVSSRRQSESTIRTDGQGNPVDPGGRYFVQDTRPGAVVGNCATWWRSDGVGYTCDLEEAGVYRGARVLGMRETDVPWRESYVRGHVVSHVRADTDVLDRANYQPGTRGEPSTGNAVRRVVDDLRKKDVDA